MGEHSEKVYEALVGSPAPRNLAWTDFVSFWRERADAVRTESGDRLVVRMNGHRVVFRRAHDGIVSIEDVEEARHLLGDAPDDKGVGLLLTVAIDNEQARIYDFNLSIEKVEVSSHHDVHDKDPRAHHLRTVERKTGRDDEQDLVHFFDHIAETLQADYPGRRFVLFGHGAGKADAAQLFFERASTHHPLIANRVIAEQRLDLSAATVADIEAAAASAARAR